MALKESTDIPLGTSMPDFELPDTEGKRHAGRSLKGAKGLLVAFTCNHCPYAKAVWPRLIRLGEEAAGLGIGTAAINPNIHPDYPDDSAARMKEKVRERGIPFPYLVDETQETARAFKAQCTPDLYLFDADLKLVYHGRLDDNWEDESAVTRAELREAVLALAAGRPAAKQQRPAMGCSIKWRR